MNFIFEFIKDYYILSIVCGAISLLLTVGGGLLFIKGLNTLKEDNE